MGRQTAWDTFNSSLSSDARFGAEVVDVSVGPDQEDFTIPKNVLTASIGDGIFQADSSRI